MVAKDKIKVASINMDVKWHDKHHNLSETARVINSFCQGCDLVVLPEMFATGFTFDKDMAEDKQGMIVTAVERMAADNHIAICGTYLASDGRELYNRCFFIMPDGSCCIYDKHHLFSLGGENLHLTAGDERTFFNYLGWNITMFVCYDLRFPKWMRNDGNAYDIVLLPANWPAKREYAWRQLQIARAIENEAYVVTCNRTGIDAAGMEYMGNSMIIDYAGQSVGIDESCIVTAELDKHQLMAFRSKYRFWQYAD